MLLSEQTSTGCPYRSIGIYGLGLIGGSIAKTIRRIWPDVQIVAANRTPSVIAEAYLDGTLSENVNATMRRLSTCDVIFLCAPVDANRDALRQLSRMITPDTLLTDVSSVKGGIWETAESVGILDRFIGGHPMAGSEKGGYAQSTGRLLENAYYILTAVPEFPQETFERFRGFLTSLDAIVLSMTPEEHDRATAVISHLPHIAAAALVNVAAFHDSGDGLIRDLSAGGFRDITRIASSSPALWREICQSNAENVHQTIAQMKDALDEFDQALTAGDKEALESLFVHAKDYRDALPARGTGALSGIYELYCDLEDEAGGIATIATILAVHQINLKNIGIVHNREFQEGVLRIETYDEKSLERSFELLEAHHYTLHRR